MSQEKYKKHQAQERQIHNFTGRYLGNWVYGSLDGVVTTFAIVAGSLGASLSLNIILILSYIFVISHYNNRYIFNIILYHCI